MNVTLFFVILSFGFGVWAGAALTPRAVLRLCNKQEEELRQWHAWAARVDGVLGRLLAIYKDEGRT